MIVTRPGSAGRQLADRIAQQGHRATWWPAFEIDAAPDPDAARAALADLAGYDLALFVSANAVRAAAPLLAASWPRRTMIGAVGASTRAAVEAELRPGADVTVIAPDGDDESGSEAFWRTWKAGSHRAQRVLLLRAAEGRDWLIERFVENGAAVDVLALYTRRPHRLSADDAKDLREWMASDLLPVIVISSSEAVTAIDQQLDEAARRWLRGGVAIGTHARIAQRLTADGYARVISATSGDDVIIAKLESIHGRR